MPVELRPIPLVFTKTLFFMLFPLAMFLLAALFWGCVHLARPRLPLGWRVDPSTCWDRFVMSVVVVAFMVHPTLTKNTMSLFTCRQLGTASFLVSDLDIPCFSSQHSSWVLALALPALLLYVIGIPCAAFLLLYRQREHLRGERAEAGGDVPLPVRKKLGFLFNGFKPAFYYWEVVISMRKVPPPPFLTCGKSCGGWSHAFVVHWHGHPLPCVAHVPSCAQVFLILVSIFLVSGGVQVQALIGVLVIVVCLTLHIWADPYEDPVLGRLDGYALLTSFFTLYRCSPPLSFGVARAMQCRYPGSVMEVELPRHFFVIPVWQWLVLLRGCGGGEGRVSDLVHCGPECPVRPLLCRKPVHSGVQQAEAGIASHIPIL